MNPITPTGPAENHEKPDAQMPSDGSYETEANAIVTETSDQAKHVFSISTDAIETNAPVHVTATSHQNVAEIVSEKTAAASSPEFFSEAEPITSLTSETPDSPPQTFAELQMERARRGEPVVLNSGLMADLLPTRLKKDEVFSPSFNDRFWMKTRKSIGEGKIGGKSIDGGLTIGNGVGSAVANASVLNYFEFAINAAIVSGGGIGTKIVEPFLGGAGVPLLTIAGRRAYSRYRYETAVNQAYNECIDTLANNVLNPFQPTAQDVANFMQKHNGKPTSAEIQDFQSQYAVSTVPTKDFFDSVEKWKKDFVEKREKGVRHALHHKKSLIDTLEEKDLINLMAEHAHCRPVEVPYLGSLDRYEKYCFVRFNEVCRELSQKQGTLTPLEQKVISLFHVEAIDLQTTTPEAGTAVIHKIHDVSHEYAKLLRYEHRKKRQAQLTAQMLAGAAVALPVFGPAAAVMGGLFEAGCRIYNEFGAPKDLKFTSHGELRVTTEAQEHADDAEALWVRSVFNTKMTEADMTDDHRHWMKLMKFDEHILHDPTIKSAEKLAGRLQEQVMNCLLAAELPILVVTDEQKEQAKRDFENELAEFQKLETDIRSLESRKKPLESQKRKAKDHKLNIEKSGSSRDEYLIPGLEAEIKDADFQIAEIESEIKAVRLKIDGEDGQQARMRKAKEKRDSLETPKRPMQLAASKEELFGIKAYSKTADQTKADEELEAKKRRMVQLQATFDAQYKSSFQVPGSSPPIDRQPDSYDVDDLKRALDDTQEKLNNSKTDKSPKGSPKAIRDFSDAKEKHDFIARYVKMKKDVKEAEKAVQDLEKARIQTLEKTFKTIREAYAFAVKEQWKEREAHGQGVFKTVASVAGGGAKEAGKTMIAEGVQLAFESGKPVLAAVIGGTVLTLVGAGGVVTGVTSIVSTPYILGGLALYGGGNYLYKKISNLGGGLGDWFRKKMEPEKKIEEKKEEKKDEPPAHH